MRHRERTRHDALAAAGRAHGAVVPLLWGMGVVFAKAALARFPPILLVVLRFTLTARARVWFAEPPWRVMGQPAAIAFISTAIRYSLTFDGLRGLDASTAVLVIPLEVPFLVLLGAAPLRERVGLRIWFGVAIAFAGVGLTAGEPRLGELGDLIDIHHGVVTVGKSASGVAPAVWVTLGSGIN